MLLSMPVPVLHTLLLSISWQRREKGEHHVTAASQPISGWGLLWLPQEHILVLLINYVTF